MNCSDRHEVSDGDFLTNASVEFTSNVLVERRRQV